MARRALLMVDSILPRWRTMPASASRRLTSVSPNRATLAKSKPAKAAAEILALPQDRQPGQAGLEAFEADLLEQPTVVGDRPAPFAVVIGGIVRRAAVPEAARLPSSPTIRPSRSAIVFRLPSAAILARVDGRGNDRAACLPTSRNPSLAMSANRSLAIATIGYQGFTIRLDSGRYSLRRKRSNENNSTAST